MGERNSKKDKTYDQAEAMQQKAVRFLRDVVGDAEKADEIESLSVSEYADRKGLVLQNPTTPSQRSRGKMTEPTKAELLDDLDATDGILDDIWAQVIANDEGEVEEGDALENIADLLNELDPERFPYDEEEEGEQEEAA